MTAMISVKVEGPVGLDEPEELLEELGRETGVDWRQDTGGRDGTLDVGVSVLVAVLTGVLAPVVQAAVERVIENWRGRRLDPPAVTIVIVQPPAVSEQARGAELPRESGRPPCSDGSTAPERS